MEYKHLAVGIETAQAIKSEAKRRGVTIDGLLGEIAKTFDGGKVEAVQVALTKEERAEYEKVKGSELNTSVCIRARTGVLLNALLSRIGGGITKMDLMHTIIKDRLKQWQAEQEE